MPRTVDRGTDTNPALPRAGFALLLRPGPAWRRPRLPRSGRIGLRTRRLLAVHRQHDRGSGVTDNLVRQRRAEQRSDPHSSDYQLTHRHSAMTDYLPPHPARADGVIVVARWNRSTLGCVEPLRGTRPGVPPSSDRRGIQPRRPPHPPRHRRRRGAAARRRRRRTRDTPGGPTGHRRTTAAGGTPDTGHHTRRRPDNTRTAAYGKLTSAPTQALSTFNAAENAALVALIRSYGLLSRRSRPHHRSDDAQLPTYRYRVVRHVR